LHGTAHARAEVNPFEALQRARFAGQVELDNLVAIER
jgi:hypothetical protein